MSAAREAILARLRQAPGRAAAAAIEQRLAAHARGPQPAWPGGNAERFLAKLEQAAGSLARVAAVAEIPRAVGDYLAAQQLAARLVAAPHPLLRGLAWAAGMEVASRAAGPADAVALSVAFCAVAETGSLVLTSGPHTPTTLNFLPDHFLCVLAAGRIVPHIEDAWDLLRAEQGGMPRALNFVTGPSRTADVEQTIQLGAHGPRRLHVILVDSV